MSKYVIECPECGRFMEITTGLFAPKKVKCTCGRIIDANVDKMTSKTCPYCGNKIIFDQSKGDSALCPVCHNKINTVADKRAYIKVTCPSCACELTVDKNSDKFTCTLCGTTFDVQKRIAQEKVKESGSVSIIKWEANNNILVWKHPIENFNLGSQLIVHESQEALFFRDGKALDLFGAGRYTLETQKIPLLSDIYKNQDSSNFALHTEIYFINKIIQTGIKWGTPSRIRIIEPVSNIPLEIGARGSFNLEVFDSRKLVLRLVGMASGFSQSDIIDGGAAYSTEYMRGKFADLIAMNVTSMLARVISENKLNVLTIDTMKPEISAILGRSINTGLSEYGLRIPESQFFVTDIMTPDDDPNYIRLKKQYVSASLDIRDEQLAKAKIEASEGRIMAENSLKGKEAIADANNEAEIARISAHGIADSAKIVSIGTSDSTVILAEANAQKVRLEGKAEADAYREKATAEAEEMKTKNFTYADETKRMVGMEAMQNGMPGTVKVLSNDGDIRMGITMGKSDELSEVGRRMFSQVLSNDADSEGTSFDNNSSTWDCACGKSGISSMFCPDCGKQRPEPLSVWNCRCGRKNIMSKFCPDCGAARPQVSTSWTCPQCGKKGITSKFCPECGYKN